MEPGCAKTAPWAWGVLVAASAASIVLVVRGCADPEFVEKNPAGPAVAGGAFLGLPVLFYVGLNKAVWGLPKPLLACLATGAAIALWCSAVLVAVPYMGFYPNLPVLPLGLIAGRLMSSHAASVVGMCLGNLLLWPAILLLSRKAYASTIQRHFG